MDYHREIAVGASCLQVHDIRSLRAGKLLDPASQFEKSRQIGGGQPPAGHLLAKIFVDHPTWNRLPRLTHREVKILDVPATKLSLDLPVIFSKKRVKWIMNNDRTRVTGIIVRRL